MASTKESSAAGEHKVRIGVFIPAESQLLDAATVDIMGSMSRECTFTYSMSRLIFVFCLGVSKPQPTDLGLLPDLMPKAVVDLAPSVEVRFVGTARAGETIKLTSNESIVATDRYSDAGVAPGTLDIVLVPGADPSSTYDKAALDWLAAHGATPGVDVLSVCTGAFLCGEAGLLKGRTACGPRGVQDMIRAKGYGEKELVGHKYRWVQDGNFWSSGGVTNGNDMVAAYCRASARFPDPVVEIVCEMLEVGDRAQAYDRGQSAFILRVAYNVARAWLTVALTGRKQSTPGPT
ncbi:class I glutamine amidotransferase-like protein [Hypoxylon sp. FL1284]|nr:class I glutamine amidotransferase-like protein [Hypoxylon sp. FL1284]